MEDDCLAVAEAAEQLITGGKAHFTTPGSGFWDIFHISGRKVPQIGDLPFRKSSYLPGVGMEKQVRCDFAWDRVKEGLTWGETRCWRWLARENRARDIGFKLSKPVPRSVSRIATAWRSFANVRHRARWPWRND